MYESRWRKAISAGRPVVDREVGAVVPNAVRYPMPFEYVFSHGVLALAVEPVLDFDRRGSGDDQARDEHGERLWQVRVMDLDPEAGKFGRSTEVRVKIAAPVQPVLPAAVEFTDLTVTPYVDAQKCRGNSKGGAHKCGGRLAWSIRASAVIAPVQGTSSKAA